MLKLPNADRFVLALTLLGAGCGTSGYHVPYSNGHAANPNATDVASLAAEVAFGALDPPAAPPTSASHPWASSSSPPPAPPPTASPPPESPARRLFGKVTRESGERVPFVMVILRGPADFTALETRTDINGRFWFPWPLPAGQYRISADGVDAAGETTVWMQDRAPIVNVVARDREPPPASD